MDNKLMNKDLIERYVLHQLNEEELALFRGRMMFDEELRKQVVETKMLMKSLQVIANGSAVPSQAPAEAVATGTSRQTLYRTLAALAGVLLIGTMIYYWSFTDTVIADVETPIEQVAPTPIDNPPSDEEMPSIAVDEIEEVNQVKEETVQPNDNVENIAPINSSNDNSIVEPDIDDNGENQIFAESSPTKRRNSIEVSMTELDDESMGFAVKEYIAKERFDTIDYLEDAIENSATKSKSTQINLSKGENYSQARDENGAIHLDLKGNIDSDKETANYIFKIYSNKSDEYEDNVPKYQEHMRVNKENNTTTFHIDFKIELPPGLYYYTIEEEVNGEKDMIYTHRIIVLTK